MNNPSFKIICKKEDGGCGATEYCDNRVTFCTYCGSTDIDNIDMKEKERIEKELAETIPFSVAN